jgi:hypothetical protein
VTADHRPVWTEERAMADQGVTRRHFLQTATTAGAAAVFSSPAIPTPRADAGVPPVPESAFFATAYTEYAGSHATDSTGDLWPSCWADDDNVYAANGDGQGFGTGPVIDVVVNRITGTPETGLAGERLATGAQVADVYADSRQYNRKPTGIVAVDGNGDGRDELYLAVQDLRFAPAANAFDDAPNASICRSDDYGRTWRKTARPMFSNHVFTTVMFLDFGRSQRHARVLGPDAGRYVYAYGLDHNWRCSYSRIVPSPTSLYLARVPRAAIQDRAEWQFFAGTTPSGRPHWSPRIDDRSAVLHDPRRVYPSLFRGNEPRDMTVLSQGGVLYNAPLDRYLYTSWTEYTFEFYEAPTPWGPWRHFLTKDFGGYPWYGRAAEMEDLPNPLGHPVPHRTGPAPQASTCPGPKNGGYACTIPAKFVSADGRSMWLQSNWFRGVGCGAPTYTFSLRRFCVAPRSPGPALNPPDPCRNLARCGCGTAPIEKSAHYGRGDYYNDCARDAGEDSFDGSPKPFDFWGFTWSREYRVDRVVYTTGRMSADGGWFAAGLSVQVRQGPHWVDVAGLRISPAYPYDRSAGSYTSYTMTFAEAVGDGVRVCGVPGGSAAFTSIAELAVYFDGPTRVPTREPTRVPTRS